MLTHSKISQEDKKLIITNACCWEKMQMAKKVWQLETETIVTLNKGFNKFLYLSLKLPNGTFKLCKPLTLFATS